MSLTSYRAAPPRVIRSQEPEGRRPGWLRDRNRFLCVACRVVGLSACGVLGSLVGRPGSDLLSRVLRRSTIGAEGFHGRVRDGIGCGALAMTTRSSGRRPVGCALPAEGRLGALCEDVSVLGGAPWMALRGSSLCARLWDQADRAISTSRLRVSPRFHPWPIDVMVYHGSWGRPGFEGGFPLRCIQRLSRPHLATRRCRWRDNRYTRGAFIPVLSY